MEEFMRKTRTFPLNLSDWGSHVFRIIDHSCDSHGILGTWYVFTFAVSRCMNFSRYCGRPYFEPIKTRHLSTVRNLNAKLHENFVLSLEQLCLLQTSMIKERRYEGQYLISIFFRILLTIAVLAARELSFYQLCFRMVSLSLDRYKHNF